ncbi:LacI family DNA-binding transcriptional regulator [Microvirga aerophila]|uniref:LacI family transcriptional regulator n=1 Tax=Microvirga aerophila TaxID=670291 RepID=A0A512BVZ4_9HYPH|nr:LacI family DNA-binding transcriptional regulator [Microvirga aerophila]GEO16110.1 LacI family transcriptional regulator [Microvirga aerophila]
MGDTTIRDGKAAVRISDVARHANVGAGTVSRVINGSQSVAPETRKRVLAAVRELGYVPNLVARSLAANRTGIIAAIIPVIGYTQHAQVIQGLTEVLHERGTNLMIGASGHSPEMEEKIVGAFLARRPDAFYLTGTWHTDVTRELLKASGLPVIEGSNLTETPIDMVVGYSNFAAGRELTRLLALRGHRHIAHVTTKYEPNDRITDRLNGYKAACSEFPRAQQPIVIECENSFEGGAEAIALALKFDQRIDALFCATDLMAVGAILECQRRGIEVPTRLGIAGFDDLPIASAVVPSLTTIHVDRVEMGRKIAEVLLRRVEGESLLSHEIDVGFEIKERNSTFTKGEKRRNRSTG